MSRKREAICMGIGILAGIVLSGPAAQAATETLTAVQSNQHIYVDRQQVSMTAYGINGNNYVKLRDVGEAVGFNRLVRKPYKSMLKVTDNTNQKHFQTKPFSLFFSSITGFPNKSNIFWNGTAVQIESDQPYTGEPPAEPELAEESVQTMLWGLREQYPTGTVYGAFYRSYSSGPYGAAPTHCAGWATLCSDAAFGDLPWRRINDPSWEDIRAGDLLEYDNSYGGHVVVDKTGEYVVVTEIGTNNKARWGGQYFRWWLEEQSSYACFTRYPQ